MSRIRFHPDSVTLSDWPPRLCFFRDVQYGHREEPKYAVSLHEGAYEVRDYSLISQGATTICASICGMEAIRNNPGVINENSSIEAANGHIQTRYRQPPWTLRKYARTYSTRASRCPRRRGASTGYGVVIDQSRVRVAPIYRANRPGSGHPHSLYSATITPIMEATCGDKSFLR